MREKVQGAMVGVVEGVGSERALHPLQRGAEGAAAGAGAAGAAPVGADYQRAVVGQIYAKAAAAESAAHNLMECLDHMVDVGENSPHLS